MCYSEDGDNNEKVNNGSVDLWTVEQIERSQKTDVANILSVPRGFYHIQRNKY